MNTPLAIQVMRFAFLVLLWLFVYGAVRVVRADLRSAGQNRVALPPPARRRRAQSEDGVHRSAPGYLVVTEGNLAGTRIPLTGSAVLIGRADDSTLVLSDDYVSTRHARISQHDNVWYLDDLGSTNGTYLGQMRLSGPVPLEPGVPVRIGKTVLELR